MLDLAIKNVLVVRPRAKGVQPADIGIQDGRFVHVAPQIPAQEAKEVFDGKGQLAFPGCSSRRARRSMRRC